MMWTQRQQHGADTAAADPAAHPPQRDHVQPQIQAIERRIQLRTPDAKASAHIMHPTEGETISTPAPSTRSESALVLRSPVLASIQNSNIKQFEADVLKRQAEHSARISDLEGRLALFHSRLATECAERGREHALTLEEYVVGPMEEAVRRSLQKVDADFVRPVMDPKRAGGAGDGGSGGKQLAAGKEQTEAESDCKDTAADTTNASSATLPNLVHIERRANLLEAQMNHHQHVTLFQARRQNFDAIDQACRKTIQPALSIEMTKADKREGGMARRFESSSGEHTRLVSEMTSSRVSSLGYLEKEIHDWDASHVKKAENFLEEIQKLKQMVTDEREERIRQDEMVVARIVERRKMLEQDIFMAC